MGYFLSTVSWIKVKLLMRTLSTDLRAETVEVSVKFDLEFGV